MEIINKLNDNNIPERLQDKTTYRYNQYKLYHPLKNYFGCILLRVLLGILIFNNILSPIIIYIISCLILIIFINKYNNPKSWKVYPRTILVYSLLPHFTYFKENKNYGGLLIIIDALMGLQSYHIQNNFLN